MLLKFGHLRCGGCAVLAGRVPGPASVTAVDDLGQLGQRADAAAGVGPSGESCFALLTALRVQVGLCLAVVGGALFLVAGFAFARFRCQVVARAFALIWSNSAWVIVPASRSCLADAI